MIEKYFKLAENKTNIRTEIIAGITTFMTMAYILFLNPNILASTGIDKNAVFSFIQFLKLLPVKQNRCIG